MSMYNHLYNQVIHPEIEPGVIDNATITKCVLEQGPTGERGRLFAEEGVHLDEVQMLRLEFKNILRIDHLWMLSSLTKLTLSHNLIEKIDNLHALTNLRELDLSFNVVETIQNLESLVNLEVLTLFHNKIRILENMDSLEQLLVFSIGDNLIEDYKQASYLRRFRHLRSLSFQGNPSCSEPMCYDFLKCALPNITYLDYVRISDEDREIGAKHFRGLLNQLDAESETREAARLEREKYKERTEFYALSFVEYLSGSEYLENMFQQDEDGALLLKSGADLIQYYEEYKEQYVEVMTELVEIAQREYDKREAEVCAYRQTVDSALEANIEKSRIIIEEYTEHKLPLVAAMTDLVQQVAEKNSSLDQLEGSVLQVMEKFDDVLQDCWKRLMAEELSLYEQCEETRVQFGVNVTELITKLLEKSRAAFGLWRELEGVWTVRQTEVLTKILGKGVLFVDSNLELQNIFSDRDILMNCIAQSYDNHMRFIDAREDVLMNRANQWRDDLIADTLNNEINRNRARVLEINYYMDNQREDWSELQAGLTEGPDAETADLLGDDLI